MNELKVGDIRLTAHGTLYCVLNTMHQNTTCIRLYIIAVNVLSVYSASEIAVWSKYICERDELISRAY